MGVSGSGKTTLGEALAAALSRPFFDADDFHPEGNVAKMKRGAPLNDDDRWPWLSRLNSVVNEHLQEGCVLACSALKESYRKLLFEGLEEQLLLVYLKGSMLIFTNACKRVKTIICQQLYCNHNLILWKNHKML